MPTGSLSTTLPVRMLNRVTTDSPGPATQTSSPDTATARGEPPTPWIVSATRLLSGSIFSNASSLSRAAQSAPPPVASATGPAPRSTA